MGTLNKLRFCLYDVSQPAGVFVYSINAVKAAFV